MFRIHPAWQSVAPPSGAKVLDRPDAVSSIPSYDRFLRRLPWGQKCLLRALTIKNFLARKGIHATIRFGAAGSLVDLEIHAWLEINGECFLKGAENFAQFACE